MEFEYEMVWTTVQPFPGFGVGCPSWLSPSAPVFSCGGNGWWLSELPSQPRREGEPEAEQRQVSGVLGVTGRLLANNHCGQVGVGAHSDPS